MNNNNDILEKYFNSIETKCPSNDFESRLLLSLQNKIAAKKRFKIRLIVTISLLSTIALFLLAMTFSQYIPQEFIGKYINNMAVDMSFIKDIPMDYMILFISFGIMLTIYSFLINNQEIRALKRILDLSDDVK